MRHEERVELTQQPISRFELAQICLTSLKWVVGDAAIVA
jgi:hypothetical protein